MTLYMTGSSRLSNEKIIWYFVSPVAKNRDIRVLNYKTNFIITLIMIYSRNRDGRHRLEELELNSYGISAENSHQQWESI